MAKTQLTKDIEEALYYYSLEKGEIVVEEVTIPDEHGIVDTLALRTEYTGSHQWRCYEIKVSKGDFRSKARLTFVGHYNYYVLPQTLYDQIREEIPAPIGVLLYLPFENQDVSTGKLALVKKSTRQELLIEESRLMHAFLHSLFREVRKAKRVEKGLALYSGEEIFRELSRRRDPKHPLTLNVPKLYDRFLSDLEQDYIYSLEDELRETKTQYENLRKKRRKTKPLGAVEAPMPQHDYPKPICIPYFRGKQFDLLALKEAAQKNLLGNNTIPLIEPVRDSIQLRKTIEVFIQQQRHILVVDNPEVGQVQKGIPKIHPVDDLYESPFVTPVYILNEHFNPDWIHSDSFAFLSTAFPEDVFEEAIADFQPIFHLISDNSRLKKAISTPKIRLTDPFTRLKNNSDYLEIPDEFFSDEETFCVEDGYIGYSDFGIDGSAYFDKGWPSRAIVLHIIYLDPFHSIRIKHFCSDSNETATDPAGKFFEALAKLSQWYQDYKDQIPMTIGLAAILSYETTGKYPGNGTLKKLCVLHYLETIKHLTEYTHINIE